MKTARESASPVALHDATVIPDRLLSEAACELWASYPDHVVKTSTVLKDWAIQGAGRAVLILDALSLRELPVLLNAAAERSIVPLQAGVTGSECRGTPWIWSSGSDGFTATVRYPPPRSIIWWLPIPSKAAFICSSKKSWTISPKPWERWTSRDRWPRIYAFRCWDSSAAP